MPLTFLVTAPTLGARGLEVLAAAGCRVIFVNGGEEELNRLIASEPADAVISRTLTLSGSAISSCPTLRVIAKHGVGINNVDVAAATALGIPVLFTPSANGRSVSELAIGLMLSVARGITARDRAIRAGGWPRQGDGFELAGKTLGLVGVGDIGRRVGRLAEAIGMRVVGYDPGIDISPFDVAKNLDDMIPQVDVLSLHCPLLPQNRELIGEPQIALMRPGAMLINTARGELVDEAALITALAERRILGAGLDSFAVEPLAADSPLRTLDNVVMTPHVGGATREALNAVAEAAARSALAYLTGDRIDPSICANPSTLMQSERVE